MGNFIMRTAPDSDVYVVWSTIVDGPVFAGTRQETQDHLLEIALAKAREEIEDDLDYAEKNGTSVSFRMGGSPHPEGAWADDGLRYGADRWLSRAELPKFIGLWMMGYDDAAENLLTPLDMGD